MMFQNIVEFFQRNLDSILSGALKDFLAGIGIFLFEYYFPWGKKSTRKKPIKKNSVAFHGESYI